MNLYLARQEGVHAGLVSCRPTGADLEDFAAGLCTKSVLVLQPKAGQKGRPRGTAVSIQIPLARGANVQRHDVLSIANVERGSYQSRRGPGIAVQ